MMAYPTGWPMPGYPLPSGMPTPHMQHPMVGAGQPHLPLIAPRPIAEPMQFHHPYQTSQGHFEHPTTNFQLQGLYSYQPPVSLLLDPQPQLSPVTMDPGISSYNLAGPPNQPGNPPQMFLRQQADMPQPLAPDLRYPPISTEHLQSLESQPILNQTLDAEEQEVRMLESLVSTASYIPIISPSTGTYHMPNNNNEWQAILNGHGKCDTFYFGFIGNGLANLALDLEQIPTQLQSIPNYSPDYDPQSLRYYLQHPAVAQLHEEDEYYDVESDEEMLDIDSPTAKSIQKKERDLSHVLAISGQGRNLRSVGAFLNKPDTLATYMPKYTSSPLMDEDTAQIFCHFVTATGPLMSGYGRHPVNPALLFSGTPVPKSQQALWTYTLPMMAISNQGLLHAILAIASLNIARLQNSPLTVPTKHYQFALRRVAKAVATPGKRTSIATVAATILLSQFEVLSAEHSKWHSHLAGARQLFTEINFTQWTDKIYTEKARRSSMGYVNSDINNGWSRRPPWSDELPWLPDHGSADEEFLDKIRGSSIKKPFHSRNRKATAPDSNKPLSEKDIDDFQTYRDLFWTYTKIDNIQSIVTGRRLLQVISSNCRRCANKCRLPLAYWAHCPPRAPMDRFDAVYGTLDHLGILIGRVADFAGKDVARKRRAMKSNGGVWKPPPGFFGPPGGIPPPGVPPPDMMPPGQGFSAPASASMMPSAELPLNTMPPGILPQNSTSPTYPLSQGLPPDVIFPTSMPPQHASPDFREAKYSPSADFLSNQPSVGMPGVGHQMEIPNGTGPVLLPLHHPVGPPNTTTSSTPIAAATPTFSGLFPNNGQPTDMPAAFMQAPKDVLYQWAPKEIDVELSEATAAAEAEWNYIQEAFDLFERSLGPAFAPLSAELGPTIDTPFGPALQYRTFQIAACWLLFYMTKVIAIRTHPSMPPASIMAAGITASKTAGYCNMIGRINCGLQVPAPDQPLNPIFGGAVAETMLPMFVAGIQYKDNAQRIATIERLQFIVDRVGQNSAAFIAAGLERTWIEMHKAGRGPKYIPSFKVEDEYGRDLTERQPDQQHDVDGGIAGSTGDFNGSLNRKRGAVVLQTNTRTFAAGVIGLEDGFGNLTIGTGPM